MNSAKQDIEKNQRKERDKYVSVLAILPGEEAYLFVYHGMIEGNSVYDSAETIQPFSSVIVDKKGFFIFP